MKAYKYRFENVLKSKKIIVDQLASKTARAQKILMLETGTLDDLKQLERRCVEDLSLQQTGNIDPGETWRCLEYLRLLGEAIDEQSNALREIARRVEMLRNMLVEAQKEKKVFEKLDEKDREEFYKSFLKKEQALLDEVGVNTFALRNAHARARSPSER